MTCKYFCSVKEIYINNFLSFIGIQQNIKLTIKEILKLSIITLIDCHIIEVNIFKNANS